jgi:secondary thiamine-phosphate synthase enzyme
MHLEIPASLATFRAGMKSFSVRTKRRTELAEISAAVQKIIGESGRSDGLATVFIPHTTAGITINEHADPDVARDLERRLDEMIPWDDARDRHGEGNTAAHLKASLIGSSVRVIVAGGRIQLGTWQGIFLCEFDGPRTREIWVSFDG